MTAIVKLVFGIECDKARLTEYAAALSYADRQGVGLGGFLQFINDLIIPVMFGDELLFPVTERMCA